MYNVQTHFRKWQNISTKRCSHLQYHRRRTLLSSSLTLSTLAPFRNTLFYDVWLSVGNYWNELFWWRDEEKEASVDFTVTTATTSPLRENTKQKRFVSCSEPFQHTHTGVNLWFDRECGSCCFHWHHSGLFFLFPSTRLTWT